MFKKDIPDILFPNVKQMRTQRHKAFSCFPFISIFITTSIAIAGKQYSKWMQK